MAGSFDNEAVAIFALITTFYLWVRAVHLGTVGAAVAAAFAYLYMAASWGAYVFISNLIPLYVIIMFVIGRWGQGPGCVLALGSGVGLAGCVLASGAGVGDWRDVGWQLGARTEGVGR